MQNSITEVHKKFNKIKIKQQTSFTTSTFQEPSSFDDENKSNQNPGN